VISTKVNYYTYDHVGRKLKYLYSLNGNLKTIASYKYDAIGRMTKKLYAPSDAVESNQTGLWTNLNTWQGGSLPTIADQVTINQGHTVTIPNGQTMQAGTLFNRGTLQNFGILQMGTLAGSSTGTLQTLDYKYHIRGGLKGINLDASGNLTNNLFSYKLDYEDDGTLFDGNIRRQYWKSNIDGKQRAYAYKYDGASRLTSATYASTQAGENYALNSVNYDANGNITSLSRNGFKSNNTFGLIDSLKYTYNPNSNKILKVDDLSNEIASFKDVAGNDYDYWLDGSLKKDNNKEITQIDYNYLKLPEQITLTGGRWIKYDYDAGGVKLKKTLSTGQVTDYEEDDIYENAVLYQTSHDEGRIVGGIFEYNINDHLGNLRVMFKDSVGIAKAVQYENRGAWGESLEGINFSKQNKNRFSYSTYENQEDFGINVFDAHARMYDAITPRFWQVDPMAEGTTRYSPFAYAYNNPNIIVDRDGMVGEFYTVAGEYLGSDNINDDIAYVATGVTKDKSGKVTSAENSEQLSISNTELLRYAAMVDVESSGNQKESYAIASTISNYSQQTGKDLNKLLSNSDYSKAIGKVAFNDFIKKPNNTKFAIGAVINAVNSGEDFSNGATYWDGKDIKTKWSSHPKIKTGYKITDQNHNVLGIDENILDEPIKVYLYNAKHVAVKVLGEYDYTYETTAGHGKSMFSKVSDKFKKVNKKWW
jgi:RHS repeat-associated protein